MSDPSGAGASRRPATRRLAVFVAAVVVVAAALSARFYLEGGDRLTYVTAKVERGAIHDAVEATGTVNAVITVQVGSQVSGTIVRLNADFNSRVRKDDVIALIGPQLFEGAVLQASADLANAKANVTAAEANLSKARAALAQTRAEHERALAMVEQRIGTQQALDLAKANDDSARASVDAAVANVVQAKAQVSQKQAAVTIARTNLDYTVIRSPIDGIVVARNVDVGQTVAASLQAPTIFTIAQDLTKMQVYTKVDESDVGRIKMGQAVTFKVDAFPKDLFRGAVRQIRMNPTTIQNVVTYDAIIEFDNPRLQLFPGMTAYVTIPVADVDDVVKIPNAALRYKPPLSVEAVRALYVKHGIDASGPGDALPKHAESAVVWKHLADGTVEPVKVALGITDHTDTEIARVDVGALAPGDDLVTFAVAGKSVAPPAQGIRR
jgi:HlyD family secretion protein